MRPVNLGFNGDASLRQMFVPRGQRAVSDGEGDVARALRAVLGTAAPPMQTVSPLVCSGLNTSNTVRPEQKKT